MDSAEPRACMIPLLMITAPLSITVDAEALQVINFGQVMIILEAAGCYHGVIRLSISPQRDTYCH